LNILTRKNKNQPDGTSAENAPAVKIPKKKRRWVRPVVIVLVIGAIAGGLYLRGRSKSGSAVTSDYLVATAQKQDLTQTVTGTATLAPADSYNVTTLMSGEIESAPFEEGDLVSKDDLLFTLDSSDAQNSANSAAIGVQQSQLNYQQAKEAMYPTATISGTVNQIYVKNGDSVSAGSQLMKILNNDDISVDFMFNQAETSSIYVGEAAYIYINGFAGAVSGTVTSISDSSMTSSTGYKLRTVHVKAKNPGLVTDDYTATATVGGAYCYGTAQIAMAGAATVYATGSGTVSGLSLMAGSTVTKGTTICTIDSESNRTQLKTAKLNIETSQITQSTAQNNMDNYTIQSPISGTVIEKNFKAGDMVKGMESGTLAVVYDLSYLKLEMNVDELDIKKVSVGQKVEITADAVDGQTFEGTVDKVSINGTTTNGVTTYPVTIVIKNYGELLPGMNVSVSIVGETHKDVLCIPVDAVSRGNVVLVPEEGALNADQTGVVDPSKIKEQPVTLGTNDDAYIEVTDGLKEGDVVLIENQASSAMAAMMGG
jgi:HlyD family secretion protein